MCGICGCGDHHEHHEHTHADGTRHSHPHEAEHEHDHLDVETRILAKNDALARANRAWLEAHGVVAVNLMGAPGSGKTTLLERTIRSLDPGLLAVIEGDQATQNDAARIRSAGAAVLQLNTGTGCHLDAAMVGRGLDELAPGRGSLVVIENVGNLVCPALFALGEHWRVVVFSATEGEDKPLKYPHMFRAADLVLINKIDLLPHLEFDLARAVANVGAVNPDAQIIEVSAKTGEGFERWLGWLRLEGLRHGGEGRIERPLHAVRIEA